jgi:hypothetical protein
VQEAQQRALRLGRDVEQGHLVENFAERHDRSRLEVRTNQQIE